MKLVIAIIALVALTGCFNMLDTSNPVSVAEAAINSIESRNTEEVAKYFTPAPGSIMATRLERMYALTDGTRVENVRGWLKYQTDVDARVQVEWDMTWIVGESEDTEHEKIILQLIKQKNKWYVNEAWGL